MKIVARWQAESQDQECEYVGDGDWQYVEPWAELSVTLLKLADSQNLPKNWRYRVREGLAKYWTRC